MSCFIRFYKMNFSDVAIIFLKVMIIKIVLTWIVSIKPTKDSMNYHS